MESQPRRNAGSGAPKDQRTRAPSCRSGWVKRRASSISVDARACARQAAAAAHIGVAFSLHTAAATEVALITLKERSDGRGGLSRYVNGAESSGASRARRSLRERDRQRREWRESGVQRP